VECLKHVVAPPWTSKYVVSIVGDCTNAVGISKGEGNVREEGEGVQVGIGIDVMIASN